MRTFSSLDDVSAAAGSDVGTSRWLTIDQDLICAFADATGDQQWIHVDEDRAAAGPFGTTVAHGFLILSLLPRLTAEVFSLETPGARLNYGANKVRFPSPVKVGSRIRATATFLSLTDVPAGKQLVTRYTVEIEGHPKPACVAETVALLLP